MKLRAPQMSQLPLPVQEALNMILHILATLLGWQLDPVANIAALSATNDAQIPNGTGKFVATVRDMFYLDKTSVAAANGITVVATLSGTGRWIRSFTVDQAWVNQTNWYINATTGSDEATGALGAPIKTWAELNR